MPADYLDDVAEPVLPTPTAYVTAYIREHDPACMVDHVEAVERALAALPGVEHVQIAWADYIDPYFIP